MTSNIPYIKEYPVYPGEYIPLPEIEALLEELKLPGRDAAKPLVNMDEFRDCFKIEMVVPGAVREDILVRVEDNVLSVIVLHKEKDKLKKKLKIHEFETECLERSILLPGNADPEFASAEYRQGVLRLYIPKNGEHYKSGANQIVVY